MLSSRIASFHQPARHELLDKRSFVDLSIRPIGSSASAAIITLPDPLVVRLQNAGDALRLIEKNSDSFVLRGHASVCGPCG